MNELRALLDNLKDKRLDYVMARSRCNSDTAALKECGISRSAFYAWPEEERNSLSEIAQRVKREAATRALMILQDAAEEAAKVKVNGLTDRDHRIQQSASTEILDRTVGKAADKLDVTSGGDKININVGLKDDDL